MSRSRRLLALTGLAAAILAGCAKHPTASLPRIPAGAPTRSVGVLVTDSLGTPAAGVQVTCLSSGIETDPDILGFQGTNAQGVAGFTAYANTTTFWTDGALVAAGTPPVPVAVSASPIRAASGSDTVLVRLVLHTSSVAQGTLLITGASHHDGTSVYALNLPTSATTDSAGHWTIAGLAPGHWSFLALHPGHAMVPITIDVPAPGSTVTVPTQTIP